MVHRTALGLVLGMVIAIFGVEYLRSRDAASAWTATLHALKAFGWTIAIELIAALTSATLWASASPWLPPETDATSRCPG